jgi:hypothetical protein
VVGADPWLVYQRRERLGVVVSTAGKHGDLQQRRVLCVLTGVEARVPGGSRNELRQVHRCANGAGGLGRPAITARVSSLLARQPAEQDQ